MLRQLRKMGLRTGRPLVAFVACCWIFAGFQPCAAGISSEPLMVEHAGCPMGAMDDGSPRQNATDAMGACCGDACPVMACADDCAEVAGTPLRSELQDPKYTGSLQVSVTPLWPPPRVFTAKARLRTPIPPDRRFRILLN